MKKLLLLLIIITTANQMMQAKVSKAEKKALLDLYESTDGSSWLKQWSMDQPVSEWYGVTVEGNHVVEINLFRNNLSGIIPQSIGDLDHLRILNLAFNTLSGELPNTISQLQKLEVLKIEMNRLKGNLPSEIGRMANLLELTA
ncbi:MAG: hypothetical protein JSV59_08115, partial [Flavobacteriaceae bacterium]